MSQYFIHNRTCIFSKKNNLIHKRPSFESSFVNKVVFFWEKTGSIVNKILAHVIWKTLFKLKKCPNISGIRVVGLVISVQGHKMRKAIEIIMLWLKLWRNRSINRYPLKKYRYLVRSIGHRFVGSRSECTLQSQKGEAFKWTKWLERHLKNINSNKCI